MKYTTKFEFKNQNEKTRFLSFLENQDGESFTCFTGDVENTLDVLIMFTTKQERTKFANWLNDQQDVFFDCQIYLGTMTEPK